MYVFHILRFVISMLFLCNLSSIHSHLYGLAAHCLFGVVFLHLQSKAGYCVQSDFTNLSRIKEQCTDSPPIAVILKGQINLTSLLLILGITIHFWSENILKVFIVDNLA